MMDAEMVEMSQSLLSSAVLYLERRFSASVFQHMIVVRYSVA